MKASDIRRGTVLEYERNPCRVMEFPHRTPGNLRAFVQVRMRNLSTGNTFETRFSSTEIVNELRLDTKELQVLYKDANGYHVMDASTYDQYSLDDETVGDYGEWLEPGMTFIAEWMDGRPIAIQPLLMVTHDKELARRVPRIVEIMDGRITRDEFVGGAQWTGF